MNSSGQPQPFAYWANVHERHKIAPFEQAWQAEFPAFRTFGDAEVRPLLAQHFPHDGELYDRLRLPSAKADVARLLLLHAYGGLYVDCHVGLLNGDQARELLMALNSAEVILVRRPETANPQGAPVGAQYYYSSFIFGRAGSSLLLELAAQALSNLRWQWHREQEVGFSPYHLSDLSGPLLISAVVQQPGSLYRAIRPDLAGRLLVLPPEDAPVQRNMHRTYGDHQDHWTQRQRAETLFVA